MIFVFLRILVRETFQYSSDSKNLKHNDTKKWVTCDPT